MIDFSKVITKEQKEANLLKQEQDLVNYEARQYLKETDWYVIRFQETGEIIPEDILSKRQEARDKVV